MFLEPIELLEGRRVCVCRPRSGEGWIMPLGGGKPRTAHDGRGEWASDSKGAGGSSPREGGGSALKEHCPGEYGGMGRSREEVG